MQLLRFFTAGNVDDGKSTLIGRLLLDSNSISTDVIDTLTKNSSSGIADLNLAQLTDGLRSERERGITIDVAYKYFTTAKRKFIVADTPGHFEYTRNMFTGASIAEVAIILIDVVNGITDQTRRHTLMASVLNIPHVVICINKMDKVDFSERIFNLIKEEFRSVCRNLNLNRVSFVPVSALLGDNIVLKGNNMPWYTGKSLLENLENISLDDIQKNYPARFIVQYVIELKEKNYIGIAGSLLSGFFKIGQKVKFSTGMETKITKIEHSLKEIAVAGRNLPVILHFKDAVELKRGDMIFSIKELPSSCTKVSGIICWMDHKHFRTTSKFIFKQYSTETNVLRVGLNSKINVNNYKSEPVTELLLNDVCYVSIYFEKAVYYDVFAENRYFGSFVLIDSETNQTAAAGTIQ